MRIHCPHLVQVAQGESLEHVLDVTVDSPHGSDLLLLTKPFLNLDGLGISHEDIDLLTLAVLDGDTRVHPHLPDELLSKEVTDLNKSASLSDGTVDGEMRIHCPHLVQVAQGESLEHVLDVTADSPHGSDLLLLTKPFLDLDGLGISHVDIDCQMLELLGEGAPLALHRDGPSLH